MDLLRQAVDGLSRKLGADDPDTLANRDNLAVAYGDAGRLAEAIALFEETLKLQTSKLGADHPGTLRTRHNLALAYSHAGRTSEAIALFERHNRAADVETRPRPPRNTRQPQ